MSSQQFESLPEIAVRLMPSAPERSSQPSRSSRRLYDALIYASFPLPGLAPAPKYLQAHGEVGGLALQGVEPLEIAWDRLSGHLEHYVDGEKAAFMMRQRLEETLPPTLRRLLNDPLPGIEKLRLWWSSATPELDEWPWEMLLQGEAVGRVVFVRGVPPEDSLPRVPVGASLRVAVIGNGAPGRGSEALRRALNALSGRGLGVRSFGNETPRVALRQAAREGLEIIHWVSEGAVSLAHEAALSPYRSPGAEPPAGDELISAAEVAEVLRYSRVGVLVLSAPSRVQGDAEEIRPIPSFGEADGARTSTYRAFAQLGSSRHRLPSVVAPLGPLPEPLEAGFWREFYRVLSRTLDIERAVAAARSRRGESDASLPVALFMRRRQADVFRRDDERFGAASTSGRRVAQVFGLEGPIPSTDEGDGLAKSSAAGNPSGLSANIQDSRETLSALSSLVEKAGEVPSEVLEFLDRERSRQESMETALRSWKESE